MSKWHWPPRRGETIRNSVRLDSGQREDGKIIQVDREGEEVLVEYRSKRIVSVVNYFEWEGHWCSNHHYEIDGIMYATVPPDMLDPGGDCESFSFDDLEGNWSSTDGGEGQWVL